MLLSLPYVKFINDLLPLSIDCMKKRILEEERNIVPKFSHPKNKGRGKANKKKPSLTYF